MRGEGQLLRVVIKDGKVYEFLRFATYIGLKVIIKGPKMYKVKSAIEAFGLK
jgi:hypothetical protein